jgi:hypothetical protein
VNGVEGGATVRQQKKLQEKRSIKGLLCKERYPFLDVTYHKRGAWQTRQSIRDINYTIEHAELTLSVDDDRADKRIDGR